MSADLDTLRAAQRATEAALSDARRERDEAQKRADRAEERLSTFTRRLAWTGFVVLAVLALAGAGIVLAPEHVISVLTGAP